MKTRRAPLKSILLLIILYILQGVVIGFIFALPLYFDACGAKWKEQGTFNFVFYPFSLKLAWAPIVDAIYISHFGRRKTWLVSTQFLLGIVLFLLSFYLTKLIERLRINFLTCVFLFVYFLLACQDISIDGWALTVLTNYNLQWASTCQTVGQTIGRFIGFTILTTFESANFTNRFIRKPFSLQEKEHGLFALDEFIRFWAIAFLVVCLCITFLKNEKQENEHLNVCQTYLSVFKLFKKTCIRQLAALFLISPIGYAATYAMTNLVLSRYGVLKETVALLDIPLIFVRILIPFSLTHTDRPLIWYYRSYLPRLLMCILIAIYLCFTPYILSKWYFYPILVCLFILNESLVYLMVVSRVGFYVRISDPCIGGTYMTLLSTIGNLGASLTSSIILYTAELVKPDKLVYPLLVGLCFLLGCLWLILQYRTMIRLQALAIEKWHLLPMKLESDNMNNELGEPCLNEGE